MFILVVSFLVSSFFIFLVFFVLSGFFMIVVMIVWEIFVEVEILVFLGFIEEFFFGELLMEFFIGILLILLLGNLLEGCIDLDVMGDEGKIVFFVLFLVIFFESNCLYNLVVFDVYLVLILFLLVYLCCLKKICVRLFLLKVIIFNCLGVYEFKFVDL